MRLGRGRKRRATRKGTASPRKGNAGSALEDLLCEQLRLAGLPKPERQSALVPGRKFRHDLSYGPPWNLAIEVQGQTWRIGGHTSGAGYLRDCIKQQLTLLQGFATVYFTADCISSGRALAILEAYLLGHGKHFAAKT